MRKKFVPEIFFVAIIICQAVSKTFCQVSIPHRKEDLDIDRFNNKTIEIGLPGNSMNLQHFHSVRIVDARPDSLAIGLAQKGSHSPFFIVTPGSFSNDVEEVIRYYTGFGSSDSATLVLIIRKFWISAGDYYYNQQQSQNIVPDTSSEKISNLEMKIEFFLQNGPDYFALYRFDTVITKRLLVSRDASELVSEGLMASLSKLTSLDSEFKMTAAARRKFSWPEIEAHIGKPFDIPILKDSLPVAGVYFSLEEFKNNKPRERNFEVSRDKLTDLIFIRQPDGKLIPEREAWGFSDGENMFIRSHENYFRLQRRGNAFYVYGSKQFKHKQVFTVPGFGILSNTVAGGSDQYGNPVESKSESYDLRMKPFELDWDDGQLR